MLSVCIPVYRYDVRPLARELLRQVTAHGLAAEVMVYDDASPTDEDWGQDELRRLPGLTYVQLPANLGRAGIRNRMATAARFDHLVLLDADGGVAPDFLPRYVAALTGYLARSTVVGRPVELVITGGRTYAPAPPADPALYLHWWYGTRRESRSLTRRETAGWLGFQSNNFLATRSLLLAHPFPTDHVGYGHEDTLWGQRFIGTDVHLYHLDNPVVHLGLEAAAVFLAKQREAVGNLRRLRERDHHLRTRLTDLAEHYPTLIRLARAAPASVLVRYLSARSRPSLYALDLLKLKWWLTPPATGHR